MSDKFSEIEELGKLIAVALERPKDRFRWERISEAAEDILKIMADIKALAEKHISEIEREGMR